VPGKQVAQTVQLGALVVVLNWPLLQPVQVRSEVELPSLDT
jgi:hypothetical protein